MTLTGSEFHPDNVYLDTPTYGLAADSVVAAIADALDRWRRGIATMAEYDDAVARARALFADIAGVSVAHVAVANQVSVFVGMVAASLPAGSVVLAAEDDFTSLLFPLLVQSENGIIVRTAPFDDLAAAVDTDVDLVAFSVVHSADGRLADVDALEEAARHHGARTLVDATQAAGWLAVDATRFNYLVASAYKWLLCPRGTAFMTVDPSDHQLVPVFAGWFAGEDRWRSIYGGPLRLAGTGRRFDVSPAWLSWIGAVPALELIASTGVDAIQRHDVALADDARKRLGLGLTGSAIVVVPTDDASVLTTRGIAASVRSGSVRVGFHLYNGAGDVDALVAAVIAHG